MDSSKERVPYAPAGGAVGDLGSRISSIVQAILRRAPALVLGLATLAATHVARAQFDVVTLGDSWGSFIADGAPGNGDQVSQGNAFQTALNILAPGKIVYNGGNYGGTSGELASGGELSEMTAAINASGADVVYLSAGGNDMIRLDAAHWHLNWSPAQEQTLANSVGANINTIVNHVLSIRPDIQVFIGSYDYVNFWDPEHSGSPGSTGNFVRAQYGLGAQGTPFGILEGAPINPAVDIGANSEMNAAFRLQEQGKQILADSSRRVHWVDNYGLANTISGYNGYFGSAPGGLGQSAYNNLPVTPSRLGSNGGDAIHLDTDGYQMLAGNALWNGMTEALANNASLGLTSTALNFGNVRIGASAVRATTASNNGSNFSKVENLSFAAASGEFSGSAQSYNPLFRDPLLASDTVNKSYFYSPNGHGADAQNVSVTSSHGGATLNLSGTGVGPTFQASKASVNAGSTAAGSPILSPLSVANLTPDADLGSLTDLTLFSASIIGPNAGDFSLFGFTAGTVLGKNDLIALMLEFDPTSPGAKSATLRFVTDQGAAFGATGSTFDIPLSGNAVPEPSTLVLGLSALVGVVVFQGARLRRKSSASRSGNGQAAGGSNQELNFKTPLGSPRFGE